MPTSSGAPGPARTYRGLLRNREYVGLLLSGFVSLIGDQLSRVALTVLVFDRTGSALLSAATYATSFLPVVVAGPLLGGLADRLPRRRLLVIADLLRAGLLGLMAVPGLPIWVLLGLLLLAVTVEGPWSAARAPLMRDVLVDDDGYQLGTGLDETLIQSGQIVGFAAAGLLLAVLSPSAALLLDALSFLVSAAVVRLLVRSRPAADTQAGPEQQGAGSAARWKRRARAGLSDAHLGLQAALAPSCRRPLLLTWAGISCSIAPEALATPWAEGLGGGPPSVGLLFAASPAGAVLGLLVVGRVSAELGRRLLLPLALLNLLPLLLCLADPSLSWALLLVAVSGLGGTYSLLARVAFVRGVDPAYRGRAFSVAAAGVTAGQGLGIAAAGALASLTRPGVAVGLTAALGLLLVVGAVLLSPPPSGVAEPADEGEAPGALEPVVQHSAPSPFPVAVPAPLAVDEPDGPPASGTRPG